MSTGKWYVKVTRDDYNQRYHVWTRADDPSHEGHVAGFFLWYDADRATACVNALDGLDPEALAAFIRSATALRDGNNHLDGQSEAWDFYAEPFDAALCDLIATRGGD